MHVHVEGLAVAAIDPTWLGLPVTGEQLQVATVAGIRHVPADRIVGTQSHLLAQRVAGSQEVLAEGVDAEALTITDLVEDGWGPGPVGDPEPAIVLVRPNNGRR